MKVVISDSVSKMGGRAKAVGFPARVTCRPDAPCKHDCYACKGRFRFESVKNALNTNLLLYRADPIAFQQSIVKACKSSKYFRYFYAGDIPDYDFIDLMFEVANDVSDTKFLAFTKKYEMVNEYISKHGMPPANLKIYLSAWGDNFMPDNPYGLPIAYIRLHDEECTIPEGTRECNGSCAYCIEEEDGGCWNGDDVVFNQH